MKLRSGKCKCGRVGPYAKPSLHLCPVCNAERLKKEKRPRIKEEKPLHLRTFEKVNYKAPARKKKLSKKRKVTGEAALFKAIWATRPHLCTNCPAYLGDEARSFYFAHIIPKSRAPERRLDPLNIRLLCFDCHQALDQGTIEQFQKRTA